MINDHLYEYFQNHSDSILTEYPVPPSMTNEKDWYSGDYAQEIHNHLQQREGERFLYRGQSPQLRFRREMIKFLINTSEKMHFCPPVQHLAIYLFDIFMDNHTIHCDHLKMVAAGCLIVAVKMEELDELIPKNSDINALLGNKYNLIEFVQMEISILTFFKWDVLFPTAAHFAEYYSLYAIRSTDLLDNKPMSNVKIVAIYLQKYIEYFLEVSLQDPSFLSFGPSVVAASCVSSGRTCLVLSPQWPDYLQNVTRYKQTQLKLCIDKLLKKRLVSRKKSPGSP